MPRGVGRGSVGENKVSTLGMSTGCWQREVSTDTVSVGVGDGGVDGCRGVGGGGVDVSGVECRVSVVECRRCRRWCQERTEIYLLSGTLAVPNQIEVPD